MKPLGIAAAWLLALVVVAGCASSELTARRGHMDDEEVARPDRIIVYNFAATADDIPADAAVAGYYDRRKTPQTAEQIARGRELGDQVAGELVELILEMGLLAERAGSGPAPREGDIVIKGEFVSIDEGSQAYRMLIGFGAGAANLKTFVESYLVTATGLRPVESKWIEAGGGKMPGMLLPIAGGAVAGSFITSTAISGGLNVNQEYGPESLEAAAERTAGEIAKVLSKAYQKRGWI